MTVNEHTGSAEAPSWTDKQLSQTRYEVRDRIALITLNRPDRMNAWTPVMKQEFLQCLAVAERDPEVVVIVVTGAGRAFCAGGDMDILSTPVPASGPGAPRTRQRPPEDVRADWTGTFSRMLGVPKPIIAAVNGAAAGRGFVLACFADLRFAAEGAKFTTSFAKLGLPAEDAISWLLPRVIGAARAADMLLSSRIVLAEEAERMGLVNRVLPAEELLPATLEYARAIATGCAPASLATIKRQLWGDLLDPLAHAWVTAVEETAAATRTPEFQEGVSAFVERRKPRFAGVSRATIAEPAAGWW